MLIYQRTMGIVCVIKIMDGLDMSFATPVLADGARVNAQDYSTIESHRWREDG